MSETSIVIGPLWSHRPVRDSWMNEEPRADMYIVSGVIPLIEGANDGKGSSKETDDQGADHD
jgi:hypothetical protein